MVDKNDGVDIFSQCNEYLKTYNDLMKYLPKEMTKISEEEKKGQKRKMQRMSLVQMEENFIKQREVIAKKKKLEESKEGKQEGISKELLKKHKAKKRAKKNKKNNTTKEKEAKTKEEPMEEDSSDNE